MLIHLKVIPSNGAKFVYPEIKTKQSACADVSACLNHVEEVKAWSSANDQFMLPVSPETSKSKQMIVIYPGERVLVPTGMKILIPHRYQLKLIPRSGISLKKGVILINSPGTIDSDYTDEIMIPLLNASSEPFFIADGDRLVQMEIRENMMNCVHFTEGTESELMAHKKTSNREGGFGHTGV